MLLLANATKEIIPTFKVFLTALYYYGPVFWANLYEELGFAVPGFYGSLS